MECELSSSYMMEKKAKKWIEDAVQQKFIKSIPRSEFKTDSIEKIGEGRFGSVVKAYWTNSHRYVACKQLTTLFNTQCKTWEKFKQELCKLERMNVKCYTNFGN